MYGISLPMAYEICSPEEQIRRCKGSYVVGWMSIEEFEVAIEKALLREQQIEITRLEQLKHR